MVGKTNITEIATPTVRNSMIKIIIFQLLVLSDVAGDAGKGFRILGGDW